MKKSSILTTVFILLAFSFGSITLQNSYDLFQKALAKERGEGNLEEAIVLYQRVVKEAKDESLAAKAQLRIGICYEKLGQKKAKLAQEAFQKVIDNYPGQTDTVKTAKEKLTTLLRAKAVVEIGDKELKIIKIHTEKRRKGYFTPDGKKLALIDSTDSPGQIFLRDIASGKEIRLTDDPSEILDGVVSPDGKMIAYINLSWDVRVVSTKGGPSKTIIKTDTEAVKRGEILWPTGWTSDSKKLLFQVPSKGLFAISSTGGEWEEIFTFQDPKEAKKYKRMNLSPDGKLIVCESTQGGNKDIYVMPVEGGESIRITDNRADDSAPFWSYDGKWLAFYSTRTGKSEIWVKRFTHNGKPGSKAIQVSRGGASEGTWTKDGQIAYSFSKGTVHVYTANMDASEEKQITKFKEGTYPRWSPDGRNIVFTTMDKEVNKRAIWVVPAIGGEEKFLAYGDFPIWSSDGKNIVFNARLNKYPFEAVLSVITVEGGESKKLMAYDGFLRNLDWSPDGRFIAFSYSRGENVRNPIPDSRIGIEDIYIIPADGGEPKRITKIDKKGYKFTSPRWSPDGKKIAFRSFNYDEGIKKGKWEPIELWTIDIQGGGPKLVTEGLAGWELAWTPDGKYIIFSKREESSKEQWLMDHRIYKVPAEGGKPEKMNIMGQMVDISPDLGKIAFSKFTEFEREFWMVENFLPKGKDSK